MLALALEARAKGDVELADQLTARAMQYMDEANGDGDVDAPPPPAQPNPQPQQQQQGQQTEPGEDGESE